MPLEAQPKAAAFFYIPKLQKNLPVKKSSCKNSFRKKKTKLSGPPIFRKKTFLRRLVFLAV